MAKYQMDLAFDEDETDAHGVLADVQAELPGVTVTLVTEHGPGSGWPIFEFEPTTVEGAALFAQFVEENGDGISELDTYLVEE